MTKSPAPAEHELVHNKTVDCISLLTRGPRPFPRLCRWKAAVGILLSDIPRVQNRKEEKPNCKGSEKDDNGRPRTQGRSCDGLRLRKIAHVHRHQMFQEVKNPNDSKECGLFQCTQLMERRTRDFWLHLHRPRSSFRPPARGQRTRCQPTDAHCRWDVKAGRIRKGGRNRAAQIQGNEGKPIPPGIIPTLETQCSLGGRSVALSGEEEGRRRRSRILAKKSVLRCF
ncbi:uncharacterized protein LOC144061641 isoform X1 [Vanacampus margaritifer]